ncbi:MAG: radical SAM protein [Elusimicrobiota bacterium]
MKTERGASVDDYRAPLFLAWQLTNRCRAHCVHCCEESGPDNAWPDELTREECLRLAGDIVACGVPCVAFGGGEPLGVPHVWGVFEVLTRGGVELKIETDGLRIDDEKAGWLAERGVRRVQISVDGAAAETHEKVRPGGDFRGAVAALSRLAERGMPPELVFVPNRHNLSEIADVYDIAARTGCESFVTGPMMRLGRAARRWDDLAPSEEEWRRAAQALKERAEKRGEPVRLSIYPWDILTEMRTRLDSPQAMVLVVPDGKVKLLNALPFAPADLRKLSLPEAWEAYKRAWRSDEVRDFITAARADKSLLLHANETWPMGTWSSARAGEGVSAE